MSRVVVIGESARVLGFALAGATVLETDAVGVDAAWQQLPDDVGLVVLTREAADQLERRLAERAGLLWTVVPG